MVVWVGYLGLQDIEELKHSAEVMYEKHLAGVRSLSKISETYLRTLVKTESSILLSDQSSQANISRTDNEIDIFSYKLERTLVSDEEKLVFERYKVELDKFQEIEQKIIKTLSEKNDKGVALAILLNQFQPQAQKLQMVIDLLVQTKEKSAKQEQTKNKETVDQAYDNLRNLLLLTVFFTILSAFYLNRRISSRLALLQAKAAKIARGDFDAQIKGKQSRDEIGVVIHHFNQIILSLNKTLLQADAIVRGDYSRQVRVKSKQDKLGIALNSMRHVLKDRNWLKIGNTELATLLSGHFTLQEITNKIIQFLGRFLEAGSGVLYIYDEKNEKLKLYSSFAYTQRDNLSNEFALGEGVVGQVAFEKKAIWLKNVPNDTNNITSGTVSKKPVTIFAFPLIYEDGLCGVIELSFLNEFVPLKKDLIEEVNEVLASHIYSAIQSEQIQLLLETTESAKKEATQKAKEMAVANIKLKEQQQRMQNQAEELQQQAEEMQQQSEELLQTNEQLQMQKAQMEVQSLDLQERNITMTKIQSELEVKADDLERASKYKSEFLANMSHELRTPLNSIILLSDMLRRSTKGNLTEKEKQKARVIYQSGNDLLSLINDILDISKIEAGKMVVNVHHFHTSELQHEMSGLFEEVANQKGLKFKVVDELKTELVNDKDKIKQVLKNFLSNAFKFTKQGTVTLRLSQSNDKNLPVKIAVEDTGVGIPLEKPKIIFEAFQQADGSVSREFGGTGLGLSISREMSRLLGGIVDLTSKEGQGSEFFMHLPTKNTSSEHIESENVEFNYAPKTEKKAEKKSEKKPKNASYVKGEEKMRKAVRSYAKKAGQLEVLDDRDGLVWGDKVVLIVEDNIDYANSLAEIARNEDMKAIISTTGKEALEFIGNHDPLVVLLDLGLPDIDGEQVLTKLKETLAYRHIPICVVSARDKNIRLLEKGVTDYLQKPVESSDIRNAILNLMRISDKYPKDLLIVEDNQIQREAIMELINSQGVKCTGVANEQDAYTELGTGNYDAVIADLGLKDGSGLNVCRFVKEQKIKIPVIVYTGKDLSEEEKRELRLYSVSIIIKDADSHLLLLDKVKLFLHQISSERIKPKAKQKELIEIKHQNSKSEFSIKTEVSPKKKVVNTDLENQLETLAQGNHSEQDEEDIDLSSQNILIVDDDIRNVFVITSALENHNANILEASNGQEALDILAEDKVDLILMDIMMPVMDGYQAIKEIRKNDKIKDIPIIAVTAKALKEDRQKCIDAGADDYITKPVNYQELLNRIKMQLKIN
jgi:CheY-like chemotaxis protein/HAMP domain-containing protein